MMAAIRLVSLSIHEMESSLSRLLLHRLEVVHVGQDRAQGIVDLVRHARGEDAQRGHLVGHGHAGPEPLGGGHVLQDDERAPRAARQRDRRAFRREVQGMAVDPVALQPFHDGVPVEAERVARPACRCAG